VFNFRASVRTAGVVAGIAALALSVFAGSALAWYNCKDTGANTETSTPPPPSSGPPGGSEEGTNNQENGSQPNEENEQAAPPVVESTPAPGPAPVDTGLLPGTPQPAVAESPAPQPAVAESPAPTPAAATPPPVVKGEIGTSSRGSAGEVPTVLASTGEVGPSASSGGLAQTGFGLLPVAILGGLALGASGLLFRRFQGC
jgi:hypothetical protein